MNIRILVWAPVVTHHVVIRSQQVIAGRTPATETHRGVVGVDEGALAPPEERGGVIALSAHCPLVLVSALSALPGQSPPARTLGAVETQNAGAVGAVPDTLLVAVLARLGGHFLSVAATCPCVAPLEPRAHPAAQSALAVSTHANPALRALTPDRQLFATFAHLYPPRDRAQLIIKRSGSRAQGTALALCLVLCHSAFVFKKALRAGPLRLSQQAIVEGCCSHSLPPRLFYCHRLFVQRLQHKPLELLLAAHYPTLRTLHLTQPIPRLHFHHPHFHRHPKLHPCLILQLLCHTTRRLLADQDHALFHQLRSPPRAFLVVVDGTFLSLHLFPELSETALRLLLPRRCEDELLNLPPEDLADLQHEPLTRLALHELKAALLVLHQRDKLAEVLVRVQPGQDLVPTLHAH
eukprot:Sspe_Gene.39654::Locus_19117_Transcript_2_2_Confidence_0.750_Length_1932::g.39654::m.39654